MATPVCTDDILRLVRRSQLVDEAKLDAYVRRWEEIGGPPVEPKKLAGALVRDGLLTYFQAEQILQGKYRGFTIGKYRILERLGFGGMGQVFLCEHIFMRRRVAIKVLPPIKAREQASLDRFYREARATAALDHPNIVRSHDVDQDGELHFLVMEYVDGVSLLKLVKKFGPLDVARACDYVRQAALGLQHAHDAGLVHRDVKPGNLMVDREGSIKILDLGLARFRNETGESPTQKFDDDAVLGTADYVAPEQTLNSHHVDARADVYALGGTLYYLLSGQPPFPDGSVTEKLLAHQERTPKPLTKLRNLPTELSGVVARMLAKNPSDRLQACGTVAAALAPWCTDPVPPPTPRELPRFSPAANAPAEPGRVPSVMRGDVDEPFARTLDRGPGSSSLSQFNLPSSSAGSRSQYSDGRRSSSGSKAETRARHNARDDTTAAPRSFRRLRKQMEATLSWKWLAIIALASAAGAGIGVLLWTSLIG